VTTVFSAYVTARGQAWADFDVYMPDRWARDMPRRRAAGIPADLDFATKPQLAMRQLGRLTAAGLPVKWAAFDEVYGRSEELRKTPAKAGLSYVAVIPCDYQVPLPSGAVIRADEAVAYAVFERRSCGNGSKGPRYSDWAMTATGIKGQYLLIRRLISRPDQLTFYLCSAPPGRPATMTYFITIAGRRWPVEIRHPWYRSTCVVLSLPCSLSVGGLGPAGTAIEACRAGSSLAELLHLRGVCGDDPVLAAGGVPGGDPSAVDPVIDAGGGHAQGGGQAGDRPFAGCQAG